MAELARGNVADRPWGRTLGALGLRGLTGQLTLGSAGKRYQIAFAHGAIVGASSPLVSDAAVRIALTGGLLSSTQVADVARKQAAAPHRDEIELIGELVRLVPEQALRLRRRVVAQRAARTFSVDRGEFVIEDQITVSVVAGSELDVRSVIYLGARQNLSEARLAGELAQLGTWFRLLPAAFEDLPQYGFATADPAERGVLELLRVGVTLAELDAAGLDPRTVRAIVYALVSYNACEIQSPPQPTQAPAPRASSPVAPSGPTPSNKPAPRTSARPDSHDAPTVYRPVGADSATIRRPVAIEEPTMRLRASTSRPPLTTRRTKTDSKQAADVKQLIAHQLELLRGGIDHFALLGVNLDASAEEIRKAYFALARQLHPDRLSALGIPDDERSAQRLFAQVNSAFALLSDPRSRAEYAEIQRRGGEAVVRAEQAKAEQLASRLLDAEEAYRRGEMALRRDQLSTALAEFARAIELDPNEADYHAMLAWTQFCAAPDKMAIANATRSALDRAISRSPRAIAARFYLGRVERMLGRDQDALRHFHQVLELSPHHTEAATEARVIEARLAGGSGDKPGGLFHRKR